MRTNEFQIKSILVTPSSKLYIFTSDTYNSASCFFVIYRVHPHIIAGLTTVRSSPYHRAEARLSHNTPISSTAVSFNPFSIIIINTLVSWSVDPGTWRPRYLGLRALQPDWSVPDGDYRPRLSSLRPLTAMVHLPSVGWSPESTSVFLSEQTSKKRITSVISRFFHWVLVNEAWFPCLFMTICSDIWRAPNI